MDNTHVNDGAAASAAIALPLLGLFLLMPPMVTLFASGMGLAGVPLIVVYLFGVWIALIVCAALLARRLRPQRADGPAKEGHPAPTDTP